MNLERMREITEKATPGPWEVFLQMGVDEIADVSGIKQYTEGRIGLKDACFISMARNQMPKLLAVAEAAKQLLTDGDIIWDKLEEALHVLEAE